MRLHLPSLLNNPYRDLRVDPIDPAAVATLSASIKEDGFWGGVVVRKNDDGDYEIVCGHHRVKGAIKAGVEEADLFVSKDLTEESMVRIYARENATQRGNSSTALAGSIAGAIKLVAKKVYSEGATILAPSKLDALTQGVGHSQLEDFLKGVPGINTTVIKQQLALLKASGDYARILKSVQKEVETSNKERAAELAKEVAKAEKAGDTRAANAAKKKADIAVRKTETLKNVIEKSNHDPLIDMRVATVLTTPSVCETFFRLAKQEKTLKYLPVEGQLAFAKHLANKANETTRNGEISSRFINENFVNELLAAQRVQRQVNKDDESDLEARSWDDMAKSYQRHAAAGSRAFLDNVFRLSEHHKRRPRGVTLHVTSDFANAIENIKDAMALLKKIGLA